MKIDPQPVDEGFDDGFEYNIRVNVCSDTPEKVRAFCEKLSDAILEMPGSLNADVMVTITKG